jgi:peptide/nickel transport system ATP-binding protein
MKDVILKVNNLKVYFRDSDYVVKAVDGVSFELERGKNLGIVGESGSGKSITSLSIIGLLPSKKAVIENGEILYCSDNSCVQLNGLDEKTYTTYRGNKISMIFQEPMTSLNPSMKCGKQVSEAILLHRTQNKDEAKQITLELFKRVKLPEPERIYNSYPHQLSGGQIQRIMIAMAISCNPDILIADEPTTALDVTVQKEVIALLKEIQKEYNMSVIFISHDLGVIKEISNDVAVMYKGKIVEYGSVDKIFNHAEHPYTKGLIACRPPLNYKMDRLPIISDFMDNRGLDLRSYVAQHKIAYPDKMEKLEPIIKIKNLSTWYPKKKNWIGKVQSYTKALNKVSFEVGKGECLGLVGESGCGKSTLSKTIMRLVDPIEGEIIFKGDNIINYNKKELRELRKSLQIIFQDPYSSLNPRLTVGYSISEPMKVHGIYTDNKKIKEKTIELMETVGLQANQYDRYPHEFSGGQRQRIVIARTLAVEPEFIICDECVSALDVSVQAQIVNLLMDLQQKFDLSYIFISHDMAVVQFISDRIMVMKDGGILERGPAKSIIQSPEQEYTRRLISAIPT